MTVPELVRAMLDSKPVKIPNPLTNRTIKCLVVSVGIDRSKFAELKTGMIKETFNSKAFI